MSASKKTYKCNCVQLVQACWPSSVQSTRSSDSTYNKNSAYSEYITTPGIMKLLL